jgi:beta-lactamase class A
VAKQKQIADGKKRVRVSLSQIVVFVATLWIISLIAVWFVSKSGDLVNAFPLLNPRLKSLGVDNTNQEARRSILFTTLVPLKENILSYLGTDKDNVAFYIEDLNSGTWVGWQEREPFVAASLLKVPIATCVMKKVDNGTWTLDTELTIEPQFKDNGFGELWKVPDGTKITVRELLEKMLKDSDNTAVAVLFNNLSKQETTDIFYHIGMRNSEDASKDPDWSVANKFAAKDLSTMFRALYNATYITRKSSNYILELLTKTKFSEVVPSKIAKDVKVAHKIGNFFDVTTNKLKNYHDCGIAYVPGHPYLYCLMTNNLSAGTAETTIASIGNMTYEYFSTQETKK